MCNNRVAARIALRMEQLSNMPTNMPEDLRIQAQIELRMLRVLNFQRQLRSEVIAKKEKERNNNANICNKYLLQLFLMIIFLIFSYLDISLYSKGHHIRNCSERKGLQTYKETGSSRS